MRRVAYSVLVTALVLATPALLPARAAAQAVALDEGAGNRPTAEVEARADRGPASPRLYRFTDTARTTPQGWVGLDAAYAAAFLQCAPSVLSPTLTLEETGCTQHRLSVLTWLGVTPLLDLRLGLEAATVSGNPYDEGGDLIDVVDILIEGRLAIPLDLYDVERHRLAARLSVAPGAGTAPGIDAPGHVWAAALYSMRAKGLRFDAEAGVAVRGLSGRAWVGVPLAVALGYRVTPLLEPFAEFVEELDFRDLSGSTTALRVGLGFWAGESLAVHVGSRVGLTETLPDATVELSVSSSLARVF